MAALAFVVIAGFRGLGAAVGGREMEFPSIPGYGKTIPDYGKTIPG